MRRVPKRHASQESAFPGFSLEVREDDEPTGPVKRQAMRWIIRQRNPRLPPGASDASTTTFVYRHPNSMPPLHALACGSRLPFLPLIPRCLDAMIPSSSGTRPPVGEQGEEVGDDEAMTVGRLKNPGVESRIRRRDQKREGPPARGGPCSSIAVSRSSALSGDDDGTPQRQGRAAPERRGREWQSRQPFPFPR